MKTTKKNQKALTAAINAMFAEYFNRRPVPIMELGKIHAVIVRVLAATDPATRDAELAALVSLRDQYPANN